ncbi:wax ester synthase/diacylglycerol acyltransferase 11-like isoform X2 [Phragmites australis]|uniref:wax ester synthase/diacylglycerol acyltransferase 11-like isoform X2 n=1 Tax=Phragmites australis TaxID=29695 RepID=UPI002D79C34C|nr:wax ester synthase/diacylglycerol acyltransferase 11-like isoform X2 [Phragmites australis]
MDAAGTLRKRPLSVRTESNGAAAVAEAGPGAGRGRAGHAEAPGEPVSPSARLVGDFYIVVVIGLATPVNLPVARAGIEAQLARYPRFRSIQVEDGSKDGNPRWVWTQVNLDDHIIYPKLDAAAVAADPDKAVEDYVASLSTLPMDKSRPLWEFHVLDFPTSEATATTAIRVHHSFGDGMSLLTLLMACTRSAADPTRLPAMPPLPTRTGPLWARPRPPASAGALAFAAWVWSLVVLAWHTVVDVASFFATILFLRDPHTLFKRVEHGEHQRKRIVHRSLSLDDVKLVRNALNCTVNDVLVGVTYAALSRYYFRKTGDADTGKEIRVRSILLVNLRPTTSLHACVEMIESGKENDVKWGNKLGFIILPFHIGLHDDPLQYVRKAKKIVDRKKSSLEVIFTHLAAEIILKIFGLKAPIVTYGYVPLTCYPKRLSTYGPDWWQWSSSLFP